jgi:hypothetical protein
MTPLSVTEVVVARRQAREPLNPFAHQEIRAEGWSIYGAEREHRVGDEESGRRLTSALGRGSRVMEVVGAGHAGDGKPWRWVGRLGQGALRNTGTGDRKLPGDAAGSMAHAAGRSRV